MPKKNQKAIQPHELDAAEFFTAIDLIEKEKGIPKGYMLEKITLALVSAYKKDHPEAGETWWWTPTRRKAPSVCS